MRPNYIAAIILCLLLLGGSASGSDHEETVAYYRTGAFNAPILEGWANQSGADFAQFELAEAHAMIRTALVQASDAEDAALREITGFTGSEPVLQLYQGKVNLADGTWTSLIYDIDARTTASLMARRAGDRFIVISLVEDDPAARTFVLATARSDAEGEDSSAELIHVARSLLLPTPNLAARASVTLPSGDWTVLSDRRYTAMGTVFGNDSFIAIAELAGDSLPELADAWNRTLLGFFITPDNSRYLVLGLAVVFVILGTLIFSFSWRARSLQQDLALIQQLAQAEN